LALDVERKSVQDRIAICLSDLGIATARHILPDENATTRERVV
jgi:hypothetical protein